MDPDQRHITRTLALAILIVAIQALFLYLMGQPPICECGYVKAWEGKVKSSGNSQHISDWYTFSHIIHGFVFYGFLHLAFPKLSAGYRFVLASGMEAGWEIFENTPVIINHYRQQALAQGYIGDSVLNSFFDTVSMCLGFLFAWRVPVWATIATAIGFELFVAYSIRDNLTLNILNFIYASPAIADWQSAL